jgi:hypothetical protein
MNQQDVQLNLLEQMLQNHDWFYHFSDDNRYYVKGRDEAQRIRVAMERLAELGLETESKELFETYRPDGI